MDNSQGIYRVIDANLNRAREGLRVLEDAARFILIKPSLVTLLRSCRHQLDRSARDIYPQLLSARKATEDLGRGFKEAKRKNLNGLIQSNFKRVEEALRVLEEFAKLISAEAGRTFKSIRYKIYQAERDLTNESD